MKRDRATWLDALKCLLIMFVVLGHALQWTIDPDCHSLMLKFIRSVQMPLFVFISGYLFREGYNGNEIVSKVMRLLIKTMECGKKFNVGICWLKVLACFGVVNSHYGVHIEGEVAALPVPVFIFCSIYIA